MVGERSVAMECGTNLAEFVMGGMTLPLDGGNSPSSFVSGLSEELRKR